MKNAIKTALIVALTAAISTTAASARVAKLPGDVVVNGKFVSAGTAHAIAGRKSVAPKAAPTVKAHRFGTSNDTNNPYSRSFGLGK